MHKEVETMLERSPRPLSWTIAMILLAVATIHLQSIIIGLLLGIIIGAYFGNYRGRAAVMDAWRRNLQLNHEQDMAKLEAEYRAMSKQTA